MEGIMQKALMLCIAMAALGLPLLAVGCQSGVPVDRFDELKAQRGRLVSEKDALEARIKELRETIATLESDLAGLGRVRSERDRIAADLAARQEELRKLEMRLADQKSENERLRDELVRSGFSAKLLGGGVAVPLSGDILFDSGKTFIKKEGKLALQNLQEGINKVLKAGKFDIDFIRIDGHTDTDPIRHAVAKFDDNWTLGAARANAVRKYLRELGGWKQYRISIASYAYTVPVDPADTKEAKAKNRRVEIYLVPKPRKS
jgi:chemotaxis protein MotB